MSIFGDTSWVNEENAISVLPPTVQWRRGDLANTNASLKNGCWQFSTENFAAIVPAEWNPVDVVHAGGVVVPSFLLDKIHLAIVAYRKRWFYLDADNKPVFLAPGFENTGHNIKSKVQIWALCKELNNEPVIVSVSGMNSKAILDAMDTFVRQVVTTASRLAKTRFARYHFWMPLVTADKQATKNNQYITPPKLDIETINEEVLRKLFTGKDVAAQAESEMSAAQEWATYKTEQAKPTGDDAPPPFPDNFEFDEPILPEDEIPF